MAHFIVEHKKANIRVEWRDGIFTCNDELYLEHILDTAKFAYENGIVLCPFDSDVVDNPEAPVYTRDLFAMLTMLIWTTPLASDGIIPGAEGIELKTSEKYDADEERARKTSTLPGGLVLY